jgi:hypothetical protein
MALFNAIIPTADIQSLIQDYNPELSTVNSCNDVFKNELFSELVTRKFRNKVVDYMKTYSERKIKEDTSIKDFQEYINKMVFFQLSTFKLGDKELYFYKH